MTFLGQIFESPHEHTDSHPCTQSGRSRSLTRWSTPNDVWPYNVELHRKMGQQIKRFSFLHFVVLFLWQMGDGRFQWGIDAQMGAGLDHETRLDLEIGPITIYILSRNMKP